MKLALACIPDEIIDQYSLRTLSSDSWFYLEIRKGMPGRVSYTPIGPWQFHNIMVASIRPTKAEVNRVHVTVGGERLDFPGTTTTHCASLTTTKCLLNSTISTTGDRFMTMDIKEFYYGTSMADTSI